MMEIRILRNCKLIDGEQYYDKEEVIECKNFSMNIIKKFENAIYKKSMIYIQINTFLDPNFKEIYINSNDFVYITEKMTPSN